MSSVSHSAPAAIPSGSPDWQATLRVHARPSAWRGWLGISTSALPYLLLSALMYFTAPVSPWLTLALALPAAGFLVRVFVMFHDCAHGSLFPARRMNFWVGSVMGLLVLSPFVRWRHDHAVHHATAGDLDRRGVGDIQTLTISEFRARSRSGRLAYRLIRHPLVMFGLGPVFAMVIGPRIVARDARPRMRRSVLATDAVLLVVLGVLCWLVGFGNFLLIWAPAAWLAGSVGIWLFYVQHQFEDAYWRSGEDWTFVDAALRGSSYLELPRLLQFFTGSIGLHHVHHLNARIPNYNLQRAHDAAALFTDVRTLSLLDGVRAVRLKLWDPQAGRLVTWAEARRAGAEPAPEPARETGCSQATVVAGS